jgi:HlyD family secretion protein
MARTVSFAGLFRRAQNSLERRVSSAKDPVVLQQSPIFVRSITWVLMGGVTFGVLWLAFAQTDEVVIAPGKLEPIGDVKIVQMPQGGVLKQMLVKEGERVSKGQILLQLDGEATQDREKNLAFTLMATKRQLSLKQEELARFLDGNSAEITLTQQTLRLDQQILRRLMVLQSTGATAEIQVLQQRNKVHEDVGRLATLRADRRRQTALLNQQIQALSAQAADVSSKLTESRISNRYQQIRSPVDGVVFDLKPTGVGFVGQGSEPVMKIVPFNALKAKVEVDSSKIGFVRVGQVVDLSVDSFPASDFGVLLGRVARIGSDALPPDQLKQSYRFPVEVRLRSQVLALKGGRQLPLQVGMSLTANIKLRKVTYLQLLLSDFKDKTNALKEI